VTNEAQDVHSSHGLRLDTGRDRVKRAIDGLAEDPRPVGRAKLAGRDDYRIHVGDYRVVYAVDDTEGLVIVARIAHRREVYRR
jgi:mRNA interferase RelE/StbE